MRSIIELTSAVLQLTITTQLTCRHTYNNKKILQLQRELEIEPMNNMGISFIVYHLNSQTDIVLETSLKACQSVWIRAYVQVQTEVPEHMRWEFNARKIRAFFWETLLFWKSENFSRSVRKTLHVKFNENKVKI